MLYFGALHIDDPVEISDHVYRVRRAFSTYAYALKDSIFDAFIELNSSSNAAVDVNNLALQRDYRCYCFLPNLAWVEAGESDVQERHNDHWYLRESLVIRGRGVDDLLNRTTVIIAYRNQCRNDRVQRNLLFITRFYTERLAGVTVIVVEQDAEPSLSSSDLPRGCRYLFLKWDRPTNNAVAFNAGMSIAGPEAQFLIFSDSNLFVEEWDICANLRMCDRYDCATGFNSIFELTSSDTLRLRAETAMLIRWFDPGKYSSARKTDRFGSYCVFNRQSIQAAGGWLERCDEDSTTPLSLKSEMPISVFESPNHALRLRDGPE